MRPPVHRACAPEGSGTRRRPIGRDYAADKNAELKRILKSGKGEGKKESARGGLRLN
jgi:hypothetical protein